MNQLTNARYLSLGTYRRNGNPVDTPVWFAQDDSKYFIFSAGNAGKIKRIRNSARARVACCDARGGTVGEWMDATCRFASKDEESRAYQLLMAKYGWQMKITNFFSRITGKIGNRVVIVVRLLQED